MQQLQRTIMAQAHFFHISVLNYISLKSKILSISFYTAAREMKNLQKSNFKNMGINEASTRNVASFTVPLSKG